MKRSYVYFNLQRRVWSERQAGKVIGHPEVIRMRDARFLVGKAGQARVRAEGRKNVHAGVSGIYNTPQIWKMSLDRDRFPITAVVDSLKHRGWVPVSYNPYQNDTFVLTETGEQVTEAKYVAMFVLLNNRPLVLALVPR